MFPIPWNFPLRKKNGNLVNIGDAIDEGTEIPEHGEADAGKVLSVDANGDLEWSNEVPIYAEADAGKLLSVDDSGDLEWSDEVPQAIQDLTNEVDTIVNDLSAKNIFDIEKWLTSVGLTYTKNDDVYTTSTGGQSYGTPFAFADSDIDITISGIITNDTSEYVRIEVLNSSNEVVATIKSDTASATGKGSKIRLNWSTSGNFSIEKPMIRPASIKNSEYAEYAMTNKKLTDNLLGNYILKEQGIIVSEYSDGTKTIKNLLDALYTDISNIISGLANDEIIDVQYIDGAFGKQCSTGRKYYAKGDTFAESYFSIYTTSGPLVRTLYVQLSASATTSQSEFNGASPTLAVTSLNSNIVPNNSRLYFVYEKYKKVG